MQHGEILGIIGQNGSGKTTLTKLFNGLLKPTSGTVLINGVETAKRSVQEMAPHVGYVFQNPNHQLFVLDNQSPVGVRADEHWSRPR